MDKMIHPTGGVVVREREIKNYGNRRTFSGLKPNKVKTLEKKVF